MADDMNLFSDDVEPTPQAEQSKKPPILAANYWPSNAALIETARQLGYIKGRVLDPTYGKGAWWKTWRPDEFVAHDIRLDGVDFRNLPDEGLFDTIAFDPPYIPQGRRGTTDVSDFRDRYGLLDAPATDWELLQLVRDGIEEFRSHLTLNGFLLIKCMSYVNGKQWRPMPRMIANVAEELGFRQIDELIHLRSTGPTSQTSQQTARRNYSQLLVFRWSNKPRDRTKQMQEQND